MHRSDITVLIQLRLLPEFIEQGKHNLLEFVRGVERYEPDCHAIEIVQDIDDPTLITMIEKWSNRKAYEGPHLQTAHMRSFIASSSDYFAGPAAISFCQGTEIFRDNVRRTAPYGR